MADASKMPLSFNIKRTTESLKLGSSQLKEESIEPTPKDGDYIVHGGDNKITSTFKKPEKKVLVIPLIKNKWRLPVDSAPVDEETQRLNALAAEEIIQETQKAMNGHENGDYPSIPCQKEIPLLLDNKLDLSHLNELSSLENYEAIPVAGYGMAMLRGMGWKDSDGLTSAKKGDITPLQAGRSSRGLGADIAVFKAASEALQQPKGKEKLEIIKGAYVQVIGGRQQGSYGQIDGFDEGTGRVFVRMAIGNDNVLSISEIWLKPVTAKEFKDFSRVLNKDKYEEYKKKQDRHKAREAERKREDRRHSKKKNRSRSPSREKDVKESRKSDRHSKTQPWPHALLKVRCIDSQFEEGKYYKQKIVVVDVISEKHCICRAENGELLDKVSISKLETVIPRTDPAYVMVVAGRRKRHIGQIIEKDKKRCIATIQILPERDDVFEIAYDYICEYTGDIQHLC